VNPDDSRGRRRDASRAFARRLAADSIASGNDTDWFEVFTSRVLTGAARRTAFVRTAQLVAPGGRLLVIAGARDEHDDPGTMPWPLTRAEIESFREHALSDYSSADVLDEEEDLVRRWLAWFTRTEASRPAPPGAGKAVSHGR
jgi:hypothetical protein